MTDYLINTAVKESRCQRCGAAILTALDSGMPVRVDATPLRDRQAEITALLDGRFTYRHTTYNQLHYRDESALAKPHDPGLKIHAQHKCIRNEQLTLDIGAK